MRDLMENLSKYIAKANYVVQKQIVHVVADNSRSTPTYTHSSTLAPVNVVLQPVNYFNKENET